MKVFLCTIFALAVSASPLYVCPPSLTEDGIPVTPTCPGNTYQITVEPSTFFVSANDNPTSEGEQGNGYTGDGDVNDAWATGTITPTANPLMDAVTLTWGGALALWSNSIELGLADVNSAHTSIEFAGLFAVGSTLNFTEITQAGNYSSNPLLNVGDQNYFYESQIPTDPNCNTPEPGAYLLCGGGLILLGVWKFCGKEKNEKT